MAAIRLDLFGGFGVASASGATIPISSKKGRALLAYLALQGRAQSREKLSGLLWSARQQAQAYNSLRHELVELRRAFGTESPSPLVIDGDTVGLVADNIESDVAEVERYVRDDTAERLQCAARLYRGALLDGLAIRDSVFVEWLAQERGRLHDLAIGVFDRLAALLTGASAMAAARQLLALDPLREGSHRALMRAYAEQGETDLALRQYQTCREMLRDELAVDPAGETDQLFREIRERKLNRTSAKLPPAQLRAEPGKSLMAVLPFDVFGHEPDLEVIAAGLTEDIITGMARFRLVSVISRHSILSYKDRALELRQFGREIGAHYVLAGSLRRSGERMRATAQLVDSESGRELWAERYDRSLVDHFVVQDELTQAIVAGIEHVLVAAEHRRVIASGLGEGPTLNQKAGWHLFRFTREDNATAIELLRHAIARNPNADRRYQALALALGLDLAFGWTERPNDTIAEMLAAAERSVSLADQDAWNHAPLSWALMFGRDYQRAIAESGRMIELNPNSGVSYGVSAIVLGHCGKPEAALDMLDKARRIAPQAPFMFNYLCGGALALYRLGRYREAADMADSAALRRPNFFQPQLVLAAALACAGETARAGVALAAAIRLAPRMSEAWLNPLMPLREASDSAHLIDGLRKAGWEE